jgi:thymidine phosphorylase
METPLGHTVGNALEVLEAVTTLHGDGPPDLVELVTALSARLLLAGALASDERDAEARARQALASGAALERFRAMVAAQGGDPRVADEPARLPAAPENDLVLAPRAGFVHAIDAEAVARAALALGAGRERAGDAIDPAVGVRLRVRPGAAVSAGDPLAELHHRNGRGLAEARVRAGAAMAIGDAPPVPSSLILSKVT